MSSLFSGIEKFGFEKFLDLGIYEDIKTNEKREEKMEKDQKKGLDTIKEAEFIFDKTYNCPVCNHEFKSKAVRAGKVKLLSMDTDLRPKYQQLDSLKYEAIVCPRCGYGALNRFFDHLTSSQEKLIKDNIMTNFKGLKNNSDFYTYDDAENRYKLALLSTIVKKSKVSERAYTCLKLAWVLRGKKEALPKETEEYEKKIEELKKEELEFLSKAYEGFVQAFSKESFPICGMDEHTLEYLCADLARKLDKKEEAARLISSILISRNCNDRIKEKARNLKEMMKEA